MALSVKVGNLNLLNIQPNYLIHQNFVILCEKIHMKSQDLFGSGRLGWISFKFDLCSEEINS